MDRKELYFKRGVSLCVKTDDVTDRKFTIAGTTGWLSKIDCSTKIDERNFFLTHSLCVLVSRAFMITTINFDDFVTDENRKSVLKHLTCHSKTVWNYVIILCNSTNEQKGFCSMSYPILQNTNSKADIVKCLKTFQDHIYLSPSNRSLLSRIFGYVSQITRGNHSHHHFTSRNNDIDAQDWMGANQDQSSNGSPANPEPDPPIMEICKIDTHSKVSIVLLGNRASGKSSSGNFILGKEVFDLKQRIPQCVKKQEEVAGRDFTVVEAPGWWLDLKHTPELIKEEILLSMFHCLPGPHAVFLLIPVDGFVTKKFVKRSRKHLEILSRHVWNHTIVLFTKGEFLRGTTIEQYIECHGSALKNLIKKCGNRYYVLRNTNRTDQVLELLEKIDQIVDGNNGRRYMMNSQRLQEMNERRKTQIQRAEERQMFVYKQESPLRFSDSDGFVSHLSEIKILLLGQKNAGKSSTGNTILDREEFKLGQRSDACVKRQRKVYGKHITVMEVPGWSWKDTIRAEVLHQIASSAPHVFLLVIRSDRSFTEDHKKSFQDHLEQIDINIWSQTIVLFTCGEWLGDRDIEQYIESEGEHLVWLLNKCGERYHVFKNHSSDEDRQVKDLLEKIEDMVIKRHVQNANGHQSWDVGVELADDKSMNSHPNMSGDSRYESSAYGTYTSAALPDTPSEWGSQEVTSNVSSGIASVAISSQTLNIPKEAKEVGIEEETGEKSAIPKLRSVAVQDVKSRKDKKCLIS